jgi:hypothetical protein
MPHESPRHARCAARRRLRRAVRVGVSRLGLGATSHSGREVSHCAFDSTSSFSLRRTEPVRYRKTEGLTAKTTRGGDIKGFRNRFGVDAVRISSGFLHPIALLALRARRHHALESRHARHDDLIAIRFKNDIAHAAANRGQHRIECDDGHGGSRS